MTKLQSTKVDINLLLILRNTPSKSILIKRGDVIGEFDFRQTNDQPGCPQCGPYRWRLRENNDVIIETTSCTINNAQAINVQFNQLRQDLLTTSEKSSLYKIDKELNFNCTEENVSQDIKITLIGDSSPFSSDYLKTTNKDVGIALIYQGQTIKPGNSFNARLSASNGTANITFSPVKANIAGSGISTGELSGSATLIISTP
ncbi:fimbrial protein [Erwiniaceae bacterium CAU 1747]